MKILLLRRWHSVSSGIKPSYLIEHGHDVIDPFRSRIRFNEKS